MKPANVPSLLAAAMPPGPGHGVAWPSSQRSSRRPPWWGCSSSPPSQTGLLLMAEPRPADLRRHSTCPCPAGEFPLCPCHCPTGIPRPHRQRCPTAPTSAVSWVSRFPFLRQPGGGAHTGARRAACVPTSSPPNTGSPRAAGCVSSRCFEMGPVKDKNVHRT